MKNFCLVFALLLVSRLSHAYLITADTTWSGDHHCTDSVTVANGATLRIDAGTTVELPVDACLRVDRSGGVEGCILANGTGARPIVFTRLGHAGGSGRWGKIRLVEGARTSRFLHCQFWYGNGAASTQPGHGVISTRASSVLLEDCAFRWFLGDCTYIEGNSSATLRRCYFSVGGDEAPNTGGEQGVTGLFSHIEEDACIFAYREGRFDGSDIEGQGFGVWVHDCVFLGSNLDDGCDLDNSDGVVERCVFYNYLGTAPGWATRCGGVTMNDGGTRIVRNNIFINCRQGIISKGDTRPYIANCTFYRCVNDIAAYEYGEFPTHQVGHPTVRNCIMWGTTSQTLVLGVDSGNGSSSTVDIDYCLVDSTPTLFPGDSRVKAGSHLFRADPLFARPAIDPAAQPDFHLKSKAGRWDPQAGGGAGAWVIDAVHSPAIDAGDPAASFALEPAPHGNRVNLGAYGNTLQASKSLSYTLQASVAPAGAGMVVWTPPRQVLYSGERIQLLALPTALYRFVRWQGDVTGTANPVSLAIDGNKSVTAVFARQASASRWMLY